MARTGAKVIKLFSPLFFGYSYSAVVFVRQGWKSLAGTKHSSLLQKIVNYGQKSFLTLGQELGSIS
jgi:hypothetical protein